jgi:hypothetical protein
MTADEGRGVFKSVLNVVRGYDMARHFACAIEKKSYSTVDPVEMAFENLCQTFDMFLAKQRSAGDRDRGLVILDKTTRETSLQKLSREFRKVGTRRGSLKNIADIPFSWIPRRPGLSRLRIMLPTPFSAATTRGTHSTWISSPHGFTKWMALSVVCATWGVPQAL